MSSGSLSRRSGGASSGRTIDLGLHHVDRQVERVRRPRSPTPPRRTRRDPGTAPRSAGTGPRSRARAPRPPRSRPTIRRAPAAPRRARPLPGLTTGRLDRRAALAPARRGGVPSSRTVPAPPVDFPSFRPARCRSIPVGASRPPPGPLRPAARGRRACRAGHSRTVITRAARPAYADQVERRARGGARPAGALGAEQLASEAEMQASGRSIAGLRPEAHAVLGLPVNAPPARRTRRSAVGHPVRRA